MPESTPPAKLLGGTDLQELITLGYLYLLAVGIVSDWVFYRHFDVPILAYSDALDVLLSPLTWLEREPRFFVTVLSVIAVAIVATTVLRQVGVRRLRALESRHDHGASEVTKAQVSLRVLRITQLMLPAVLTFSGYVGFAAGAGKSRAASMHTGTLAPDHQLTFADGRVLRARLVGNNSGFVFYVPEGARAVIISPLRETLTAVQRLADEADGGTR